MNFITSRPNVVKEIEGNYQPSRLEMEIDQLRGPNFYVADMPSFVRGKKVPLLHDHEELVKHIYESIRFQDSSNEARMDLIYQGSDKIFESVVQSVIIGQCADHEVTTFYARNNRPLLFYGDRSRLALQSIVMGHIAISRDERLQRITDKTQKIVVFSDEPEAWSSLIRFLYPHEYLDAHIAIVPLPDNRDALLTYLGLPVESRGNTDGLLQQPTLVVIDGLDRWLTGETDLVDKLYTGYTMGKTPPHILTLASAGQMENNIQAVLTRDFKIAQEVSHDPMIYVAEMYGINRRKGTRATPFRIYPPFEDINKRPY